MINGVTQLVMTKLDVLNNFKDINYCNAYEVNGALTKNLPFDITITDIQPKYKTHEGWRRDLDDITAFEDLPTIAKSYIYTLEKELGVPITMVSTGPEREKLIVK